jgi:flagellar basal body-associated protein FliL
MTSTPDTEHKENRWKIISIVAILIALVSVILNVYFYLLDESEIAPSANNETNHSTVLNISDENKTEIHRIARVVITPGDGDTTKID